ncbi:MAG TPA: 50S ribosomal protein L3 [Gemmataceae bacterium]|jgi:large subunit ribosomal protein L3|nr:50S ribosomal protein L3 [Gemmataceae bacterium]
MPLGLLGQKVGMTHIYDDKGMLNPVTVINLGPCPVLQVRTEERDGYNAVQLGFKDKSRKRASRAERGHVASDFSSKRRKERGEAGVEILPKANVEPQQFIREFRLEKAAEQAVGTLLTVDAVFGEIKQVDVIGTSKGRGFQGVMRRHGYGGLRGSHGVKKGARQRGSTGSHAANRGSGRPKRGIRMAGQMGNAQVTTRNLTVVKIDKENNLMLVRGGIPGPNGGIVLVRPTTKKKLAKHA